MKTGIVKWWNDNKGYGYLEADGVEVFAHFTAIEAEGFKTLSEGETVRFETADGPKGPQAVKVFRGGK